MQEIAKSLENKVKEVKHGSVGVVLKIHNGRIVQTVYSISKTELENNKGVKNAR